MATALAYAGPVETICEKTNFDPLAWTPEGDVVHVTYENGEAVLRNDAPTANWYDYQYWLFSGVELDTSKEYTFTLTGMAVGTGTANIRYKVGDWGSGATGSFNMTAGDGYKDYSFKFTPTVANNNGIFLQHGDFVGTIRWKKATITYLDTKGMHKVLEITSTANKTEPYESQVFINLPEMTAGQEYHVHFYAKSTANFEFGSEAIDDKQTDHKDQYNNSAIFNYTAAGEVTNEYKDFWITLPGKTNVACTPHNTTHENFEYAATALLLNIGKLPQGAVFTISDISLFDKDYKWLSNVEITSIGADDKTNSVYFPNWQNSRTVENGYEQPTVNLNDAGYATYSNQYDVAIATSGVTAYKAAVGDETITLTPLNGYIPAGTGVLLYGATADKLVEFVEPAAGATAANVTGNALKATTKSDGTLVTKEANSWALGDGNKFLTFTGSAYIHNRAYLVHTNQQQAKPIVIEGETTGINNAINATARTGKMLENGRIVILKNGIKYNTAGQVIK